MFGLSKATELFQGSTERTWNCVLHFIQTFWNKLNHISRPIMPKSRKRHHSRSRSRSPSREREEKYKKVESHDRDGKRRKVDSDESPNQKRSVSSDSHDADVSSVTEPEVRQTDEKLMESLETDDIDREQSVEADKRSTSEITLKEKDNEIVDAIDVTADDATNVGEQSVEAEKRAPSEITLKEKDNEIVDAIDVTVDDATNVGNTSEKTDEPEVSNNDTTETATSSTSETKETSEITPKKSLTPKQLRKAQNSDKKRQERQKEKEEKDRAKNEERERVKQEKLKKKEEKQRELEQKQKEKEIKEELRRKEKEEKEQKRKEKEEKEEHKRKEREQEKLKKQLEIDEKNKERQKEEEKKQKTVAAFVNFFVAKKADRSHEEKEKKTDELLTSAFMAFEVKSDMKLPPPRRAQLTDGEVEMLDKHLKDQSSGVSYLRELKSGRTIGKSSKTWPFEETSDDDVVIVEDDAELGETIGEDKCKIQKYRAKFLKFDENRRPPYYGTWRKKSKFVKPRNPFAEDSGLLNYEEDSDDDWEEEEQGESLNGSDEEADKENENEKDDYEVDNEFFVPHGHLSDDEIDDEEKARLSPESLKQKLKLLKDEFDQDMQSKTHKLKPRSIGCIWYNKDGSNVEEAIDRYLQPLAMICNGPIVIKRRSEIAIFAPVRKPKPLQELNPEHIPAFLKIIHGNRNKKRIIVEQFFTSMANDGIPVDISKSSLLKHLKEFAVWKKCKEIGPMENKFCWNVLPDVADRHKVNFGLPKVSESVVKT